MNLLLLNIVEVVMVVLFLLTFVLFVIWMVSSFFAKVPFIPVPSTVMKDIDKHLMIKEGSVVYDLGCGDGRVLFYLAKLHKDSKFIGIENSLFPFMLAKFMNFINKLRGVNNVTILRKNFFHHDLSDASHVFVYLYPQVMDDMLNKLENELPVGARLVSASFQFTLKRPTEEVDLARSSWKLARKLCIYQF